jgi:hypothetical protein
LVVKALVYAALLFVAVAAVGIWLRRLRAR